MKHEKNDSDLLMKLTIEQALQRGIAAHKEGKLREAERFYQTILQSHPSHPNANHNLGVLAVSLNKAEKAERCGNALVYNLTFAHAAKQKRALVRSQYRLIA